MFGLTDSGKLQIAAMGTGLSQLAAGQPVNILGSNAGKMLQQRQMHSRLEESGIMNRFSPEQRGILAQMPPQAAMRIIAADAFRPPATPRQRGGGQDQSMTDLYGNPMATDSHRRIFGALMRRGVPGYSRGGTTQKAGFAVVGEAGPELVKAPKGTKSQPIDPELMDDAQNPGPDRWVDRQKTFDDSRAYQTADMSGIKPSGVGEQNQLNAAARSFQGFMKSLQDYEVMFIDGGSTARPGVRKDQLSTAHRDLQMQMKELYNLGVLNGPDLELMEQILLNPTSIMANVADVLDGILPGNQDMEQRIPANINEVRRMMVNRTEPALQQLGMTADSLMPKQKDVSKMSDDELLKALGGGS